MEAAERRPFDLAIPASNGLRRGRTTGTCATAAVKAALHLLLDGELKRQVRVSLPDGLHYLEVPVQRVQRLAGRVRAEVLKDGGDDPDNTHGATIFAEVARNDAGTVRFFAGRGVGTATAPGLRVAVGEPAINPVPRQMMRQAVAEVADDDAGFDLTIGCEEGEAIAPKTFNPRLGIVGGISILGTSGIVEPMSLATWIASIEVYVRVALAGGPDRVAYLPGKIGREYARDVLGLPDARSVQIANFLGDALDFTERALREAGQELDELWLAGHPGKLAKVLDGYWDTHSSRSTMAMGGVARVAAAWGYRPHTVRRIEEANTVEAAMEVLNEAGDASGFWREMERRIGALAHARVPSVRRLEVRLFDLAGNLLGARA
ncbi:cobalt-precorrin-5B (C(1))-methyltransferase CbiD [Pseudoduganella chitinolytica]|uniref:Cobalt-precorrin-5B C(1)-methyltransferase n=1 Tax=Pseudoduganella chitinolytica TaxID=34070 RepID=A0ABY8BIN5_9BURK|nr:cobalt-precorrin-5B (C(1))-methyltransferase CbiD [Pseudoduganella chitinolytica]WEF34813.1 cobalt-precorrin-5B (C(1))-methyltransferase CbiD [Pseudoduganella chitinolytica]